MHCLSLESLSQSFSKNMECLERAHTLIPAGAHTYSKGDDCFPRMGPHYVVRGSGCRITDVDGHEYIDMGMALTSGVLGFAFGPVLAKIREALELGAGFSLPHVIEMDLAEKLISLIPSAEMVKLGKHGSDATTGAVKLARAFTGRDKIAVCADQPFFSTNDWFIGTTPCDTGIPKAVKSLTVKFRYNDLASVERMFAENPGEIACVMLQPMEFDEPAPGYLEGVQTLCRKNGALLIFDEVISGFRWHLRGAQHVFGVTPDLSCFGKSIANGYSVSALVGRRDIMELGGTRKKGPKVFLLSTTHGGEVHEIAAALATIEFMEKNPVQDHLYRIGNLFRSRMNELANAKGIADCFFVTGRGCRPLFVTRNRSGENDAALRTLFMQEMSFRGVLIPQVAPSWSMSEDDMNLVFKAAGEALDIYAKALDEGTGNYLVGNPMKPVFRPRND